MSGVFRGVTRRRARVVYETYFLDTGGVDATLTFENGDEVSYTVGDVLTLTLPANADTNGDGRVDFTIDYDIDTRFTHYMVFAPQLSFLERVLLAELASYRYTYNDTGGINGVELFGANSSGPIPGISTCPRTRLPP